MLVKEYIDIYEACLALKDLNFSDKSTLEAGVQSLPVYITAFKDACWVHFSGLKSAYESMNNPVL